MPSSKKQKVVYVNKGARPSRFLVDLLKANEPVPEPPKSGWQKYFGIEYLNEKLTAHYKKRAERIRRLAFFSLFKALFIAIYKCGKAIYKLCYWFGWIFLFIIRFVGIIFYRLLKIFANKKTQTNYLPIANIPNFDNENHAAAEQSAISTEEQIENKAEQKTKKTFLGIFKKNKKEKKKIKTFQLIPTPLRPLFNFILILAVIILPLKMIASFKNLNDLKLRVVGISEAALGDIKAGAQSAGSLDFAEASKDFSSAGKNFLSAKQEIGNLSVLLNILGAIVPNNDIKLAGNANLILEAGRLSSEIGLDLIEVLSVFNQEKTSIEQIINSFEAKSDNIIKNITLLNETVKKIDANALPEEYKNTFIALQEKSDLMDSNIKEFFEIIKLARVFLGFEQDKRYLFVFQNNAELRASGGFIGSYALVDFRNGEIIKMDAPGGGSYDTEGGLKERITAPARLALVNPLWHFWDANWWPDWPRSADKLAWFYEKSGGPTVDGVISFTPTVLERLLEIIGPLDMSEKYGLVINTQNFWQTVQVMSEQKPASHPDYEKYLKLRAELFNDPLVVPQALTASSAVPDLTDSASAEIAAAETADNAQASSSQEKTEENNAPKLIIGDMFAEIQSQLKEQLSKEAFFALAGMALGSLNEKHILFYFNGEELEAKAASYGWTGEMKNSNWDYLMAVNTNIAGAKTDRVIAEEIRHSAEVSEDGTIIDTVEITRRHQGIKGDAFTGVRNVNWLRVYVPAGSRLLSASGFRAPDEKYFEVPETEWHTDEYLALTEGQAIIDAKSGTKIFTEAGKTVFANWCMADPGETVVIRLKYVLPFKMAALPQTDNFKTKFASFMNPEQKQLIPYALMAQKQPGTLGSKFYSELKLADKFRIVWRHANEGESALGWQYAGDLRIDRHWAILAEIR